MTLREFIRGIELMEDGPVIYASKNGEWNLDAKVMILHGEPDTLENKSEGLTYFLEIEIAKEVLKVWRAWRNEREPNEAERIEAILHYADFDAYIET